MNRYVPLALTLIVIGVNAAANILPINGYNTGQLSALYPTGFTPAGWVFGIWSLIYIGLIALSVWAIRAKGAAEARVRLIFPAFATSCVANASWIFVWHYRQILASLLVMLVLLASLIVVYVQLRRSRPQSTGERLCMDLPISLYLGWITTATIVNAAAWFYDRGAYPFGFEMNEWAILSVTAATAVFVAVGTRTRDALYVAVFAWASLGIVLQKLPIWEPVRLVAMAACAAVTLLVIALLAERLFGERSGGERAVRTGQ